MTKKTSYFSHDANARNDEKILAVRMRHGAEGYGVYFMILERMRDSKDYIHVKDYNIIAFDLRVSNALIKSIVEDFGLFVFTEDGMHFYSESFKERMIPLENLREQRRKAGLKSAEKRAKTTTVERPLNDRTVKNQQSKVKESKEKNTPNGVCENPVDLSPENPKNERLDFREIINIYHSVCESFPKVEKLTDARKNKIKKRVLELHKQFPEANYKNVLANIFQKMEDSDFLRGNNKTGWKATFDWVFQNEQNWLKVYEGNYKNRSPGSVSERYSLDELKRKKESLNELFK